MTDKKTPPQILFMMIKPEDLATFTREFTERYGVDTTKIYMEWFLSKMKSVQNSEEKKDVYIPKAGEVKRFLEVNRWECNSYPPFEDNTYEWTSPEGLASVFLAIADKSDVRVKTWDVLACFFRVDQENLFDAIRQCAKIEPCPEAAPVPAKTKKPDETEVLNARDYNRGFRDGVKSGIKHESQFAEVADLTSHTEPEVKPSDGKKEIPTNAQLIRYLLRWFRRDLIETEYIRDNVNIYELRSSPKKRGKKIICLARKGKMKLSRWQKIQEPFLKTYGCDLSEAHETYTHPEIKPSDDKGEIPTNAQIIEYLRGAYRSDSLKFKSTGNYWEISQNPDKRDPLAVRKPLIILGKKGKMKPAKWKKKWSHFLATHGHDMRGAIYIDLNTNLRPVEASKSNV